MFSQCSLVVQPRCERRSIYVKFRQTTQVARHFSDSVPRHGATTWLGKVVRPWDPASKAMVWWRWPLQWSCRQIRERQVCYYSAFGQASDPPSAGATQLVKTADCRYTVTVAMLKKVCNRKVSERCIATALSNEGISFQKLLEKPVPTAAGIAARLAFARKYHLKPKSWWSKSLRAANDGKFFKACLNDAARTRAAQRATFGG